MTESSTKLIRKNKPKLLQAVHDRMRTANYSNKTIEAYTKWIKEFIIFNNKLRPENPGKNEVENFLTYLAVSDSGAKKIFLNKGVKNLKNIALLLSNNFSV